jgi:hypothetical protein
MTTTAADREVTTIADINRIGTAFFDAQVVLTAVELGLFTELAAGPGTSAELAARTGLHPRAMRDLLVALATLGVLRPEGDAFANGAAADAFLDRGKPTYAGAFLERANQMMYPVWGRLAGLLRTGEPQSPDHQNQPEAFAKMMSNPQATERFLRMMDAVSAPIAAALADAYPWPAAGTVVDAGGARGNVLGHVVGAHPGLRGVVFDLPPLQPYFDQHMAGLGLADRTRFAPGDFLRDPIAGGDVIIMGHVLHDWSPDERAMIIRKAFDALPAGGDLLIYDAILEDRPADVRNTMISLNMQLISPGGSEYTLAECAGWLRTAGFAAVTDRPIGEYDTLIRATKPA